MKRKYMQPSIIGYKIIVDEGILKASTPIHLGGPDGLDFKYNQLEEQEILKDDWEFTDQ